MGKHTIKKGLDLPVAGAPEQKVEPGASVTHVAVMAADYVGMKPTMFVRAGDSVKRGQPLFEDKKSPGIIYTAPGAGTVSAVNRGDKRALQSVVVELSESEQRGEPGADEAVQFENYSGGDAAGLSGDVVRALLIESGLWSAFRTRPYSRVPAVESSPDAIFITAMDTNPHAPDADVVLEGREADFQNGLACIAKLRDGQIYLCKDPKSKVAAGTHSGITEETFEGPHPSGTVGLHIHTLFPVNRERVAWHIGSQDVAAIGHLFSTGELDVRRVVSLSGPSVKKPRLLATRIGASTDTLIAGELEGDDLRIISGNLLSGRSASGDALGYLGRYHQQISALSEGREREFLGWLGPGSDKYSVINTFISKLSPGKKFNFTTSTNGSARAMVPIGNYERVMPLDILPTFLLRYLVMGAVEDAEKLGCLELDEEDLALCTYVCPGKYEYGPYLRAVLTQIELEG